MNSRTNSRGYKKFLEFKQDVYDGKALPSSKLVLNCDNKIGFTSEEWNEERKHIAQDVLPAIAELIKSGLLPDNTSIFLTLPNIDNQGFISIVDAIKRSGYPTGFKLQVSFKNETVSIVNPNCPSRELSKTIFARSSLFDTPQELHTGLKKTRALFGQYWETPLIDLFRSGFGHDAIKINYPSKYECGDVKNFNNKIAIAKKSHAQLFAQQQAVVLKQGQRNGTFNFPEEIINLMCYFLIKPTKSFLEFQHIIHDSLLVFHASCFLDRYKGGTSGIASPSSTWSFYNDIKKTVNSTQSKKDKAASIKSACLLFTESFNKDDYKKSQVATDAKICKLISGDLIENPDQAGEFKLR